MKPFLLSALALGALTTAALAEQPTPPPEVGGITKTQNSTTAPAGPIELTDTQMDQMTAGVSAIVGPTLRDRRIGVQVVDVPQKAIDRSRVLEPDLEICICPPDQPGEPPATF